MMTERTKFMENVLSSPSLCASKTKDSQVLPEGSCPLRGYPRCQGLSFCLHSRGYGAAGIATTTNTTRRTTGGVCLLGMD